MAYDEALVERVRAALASRDGIVEKKMFGGVAFMIGGHMSCGVVNETLMVRVDPEREAALLQEPGARPMDFTGRPMRGFLHVEGIGLAGAALRRWVRRAADFAESRPPKARATRRAKPRSTRSRPTR